MKIPIPKGKYRHVIRAPNDLREEERAQRK